MTNLELSMALPVVDHKGRLAADSRDIAPLVKKNHGHLLRDIRRYMAVIDDSVNPKLDSPDYFIPAVYIDDQNKSQPYFLCTQMGCDMIAHKMTGEKGIIFTAAYVRAFRAMEKELSKRRTLRTEGKPIRRSLTDAVRDSGEQERMHGHAYEAYTNLALKLATGRSAAQLRRERGASKGTIAADLLTSDELKACQRQEAAIAALLDIGLRYDAIREVLGGKRGAA